MATKIFYFCKLSRNINAIQYILAKPKGKISCPINGPVWNHEIYFNYTSIPSGQGSELVTVIPTNIYLSFFPEKFQSFYISYQCNKYWSNNEGFVREYYLNDK